MMSPQIGFRTPTVTATGRKTAEASAIGCARFRTMRAEAPAAVVAKVVSPLSDVPIARLLSVQNIAPQQAQDLLGKKWQDPVRTNAPKMQRAFSFTPLSSAPSSAPPSAPPSPAIVPRPVPTASFTLGHMPVSFIGGSENSRNCRKIRIFCYGDSLTVGWYLQGRQYEPYGRALAEQLGSMLGACEVTVCGHSGHTVEQMVANADKLAIEDVGGKLGKGLRRCLDEVVHRPDIVLIMAGTNDIGRHAEPRRVLEDLVKLHSICHSRQIPTVAVAPPQAPRAPKGSAFENSRSRLHTLLAQWAKVAPGVAAFIDPAELVPAVSGGACWDPDGLHFSPTGSRLLGKRFSELLAPLMRRLARA